MWKFFFYINLVYLSYAFNLETRLPIIKRGPAGSYFGYSVAQHQSIDDVSRRVRNNWLLVGAPLGDNLQPNTTKSGALWRCPITTLTDDCDQVVTDGKRNAVGQYPSSVDSTKLMPPFPDEIKDGQWMGVTVRSQKPGGKVMVCAHRYIRTQLESQYGYGLCYTLTQDLDFDDTWEPCRGRDVSREHETYGYCQAGTSGVILDDDTAVIGTPGPYTWRGTIFVMSVSDDYLYRDKINYFGPHNDATSPVDKYSYLGMSVTGANFFSDEMSYAAGAPRANGTGQVVLFGKHGRSNPMNVKLIIPGEQFASSFGYELSSADLNGDGLPELIVGAPFYFTREKGGAVYIYYNNKERCLSCAPPQKLTGLPESRFGFAIANIGKLNLDRFDDLAVGAPYEDEGVVYIYLGSENGLISEPSQVMRGNQIRSKPVTFGYSLSGGVDLDSNGQPDLLVGAYGDDKVVLLRARPIIDITTEVTPETALRNIDPTRRGCDRDPDSEFTCFSFQTCCTVNNPHAESLLVLHRIEAETFQQGRKFSRVWFGSDNVTRPSFASQTIALSRGSATGSFFNCQEHVVYLKEKTQDIQSAIKMKLSYTLVQKDPIIPKEGDPLPNLYPILNQQEAAKIVDATFQKDCGDDDVCQSDLSTYVVCSLPPGDGDADWALMLGTVDHLPINVTINNYGESAYETQFFIFHPSTITYNKVDSESKLVSCKSYNATVAYCQIGNPLKSGAEVKFQIKFDVRQVGDGENKLDFTIFTNTTSQEKSADEPTALKIAVVKKAEVSIKGSARPEQVFYSGAVRGESAMIYKDDIGTRVIHTYQAYNAGPWRVRDLQILIKWPIQVANNKPQGKWLLYLDEVPTVEAHGGGQCYLPSDAVNPLHLESRLMAPYDPLTSTSSPDLLENKTDIDDSTNTLRRRRREMKIRSERIFDAEGRAQHVVNMNCVNGTAKCLKIKCVVFNLRSGQEALIRVSARLWNSTLVEDYPRVSYVSISSRAELAMEDQPLIQNRHDDVFDVTTLAYPELHDGVESDSIPIWIVLIAVFAGILFLVLIVLVLWKIGFFKRNRPDPTLSGNIQKANQDLD